LVGQVLNLYSASRIGRQKMYFSFVGHQKVFVFTYVLLRKRMAVQATKTGLVSCDVTWQQKGIPKAVFLAARIKVGAKVARWYIFKPKNPNLGKLWREMLVYILDILSILRSFGIFNSHLVYVVVIWYMFLMLYVVFVRKIW
jgi:hypothetical protein